MTSDAERGLIQYILERGYNVDREAITLLVGFDDPELVANKIIDLAPADKFKISGTDVREFRRNDSIVDTASESKPNPSVSTGNKPLKPEEETSLPQEIKGSDDGTQPITAHVVIADDITGESTGTGEFDDFVALFRDRYESLSKMIRSRVNHRPISAVRGMSGRQDVELIGMINSIRTTANGHWMIELEDTTGNFRCLVMKDRELASVVPEMMSDEVIGISGSLSNDAGIIFVDSIYFPDIPRTNTPSKAERPVQAALISDIHVGSQEFAVDAWYRFADWLHTDEAELIEYLLIGGDMVEGVGVYPNQDKELSIIDIFEQYQQFSEYLKAVPGDIQIVVIPGNHDAVRLAEPQPAIDEELQELFSTHNIQFSGNPSSVTIEGVTVLMYHGMSLDEIIADLPTEMADYDHPHRAMEFLLKKRHLAPTYGGKMRIAPELRDHLVIDSVPDIFHSGHVHKIGHGTYHGVLTLNSGCWQTQTSFQRSVNIQPDVGIAPIIDLNTLNVTFRKFH